MNNFMYGIIPTFPAVSLELLQRLSQDTPEGVWSLQRGILLPEVLHRDNPVLFLGCCFAGVPYFASQVEWSVENSLPRDSSVPLWVSLQGWGLRDLNKNQIIECFVLCIFPGEGGWCLSHNPCAAWGHFCPPGDPGLWKTSKSVTKSEFLQDKDLWLWKNGLLGSIN